MNALQVAERSAVYALQDAVASMADDAFELMATAPQGVARLRELILDLAVHGRLLPQDDAEESAATLLLRVHRRAGRRQPSFDVAAVPPGWVATSFQEIANELCTGPFGSLIGKNDYVQGGIPLINPSHLHAGRIIADERVAVSPSKARDLGAYALNVGDIVFARRGDVGRNAVVADDQTGWLCGTGSFFARFDRELCRAFLHIVFNSPSMRRYLLGSAVGATMVNLNQKVLLRAPVWLPPLAEQRRIIARVEELMGLCDELEAHGRLQDEQHARLVATLFDALVASASPKELAANWQRIASHFDLLLDRPEAVDALEQTILQLAVRGLLVPQDPADESAAALLRRIHRRTSRLEAVFDISAVPAGWVRTTFHEVANELCTGPFGSLIGKGDYVVGGVPLINPSHLHGGRIVADERVSVSLSKARSLGTYAVAPGDIVFARRGDVGRNAVVADGQNGWLCGTGSFFARFDPELCRPFLHIVFESPSMRRYLCGSAVGSTMVNLNQKVLMRAPVWMPPIAEQCRIVTRVEQLRALCADLRQHLQQARTAQSHLADALVNALAHDRASASA